MKTKLLWFLVVGFITSSAFSAPLAPTVKEVRVNGYRVLLINQHQGNQFKLTVNAPTGSWHDDPVYHAGLAHLWEHVIFRGTEKFPDGEKAFTEIPSRIGGNANANTGSNRTRYFMNGHPDGFEDVASFLGSMMSAPSWNAKYFAAEKKVVMNEALSYQAEAGQALEGSVFMLLLPPQHPLGMYDVGAQDQLEPIEMGDLKDLFFTNYTPENLTILVAGNFDTEVNGIKPLSEKTVLESIARNFVPPHDSRPALHRADLYKVRPVEKVYPPLITEQTAHRAIEIKTDSQEHLLHIYFDLDTALITQHPEAFEMLVDFLNLSEPGSLNDSLKKEGLISDAGIYPTKINNLTVGTAIFRLTKEGAARYNDVVNKFFATLNHIRTHGISPNVVDYIRQVNVSSYENGLSKATKSPDVIADSLPLYSDVQHFLKIEERYAQVTPESIKDMAQKVFLPETALLGVTSPDLQISADAPKAPVFDLPYRLRDDIGVKQWAAAAGFVSNPQIKTLATQERAKTESTTQWTRSEINSGFETHLRESHLDDQGGVVVYLKFPPANAEGQTARILLEKSFKLHFQGELNYLRATGLDVLMTWTNNTLQLNVVGNAGAALERMEWLLAEFKKFRPTVEELKSAANQLAHELESGQNTFSAKVASQAILRVRSRYASTIPQMIEMAQKTSLGDVVSATSRNLKRADVQLYMVGDLTSKDVERVANSITQLYPQRRTGIQNARAKQSDIGIPSTLRFAQKLAPQKSDGEFGHARLYKGVKPMTVDHAALVVLADVLGNSVFNLNRSTKGLGYVHQAYVVNGNDRIDLSIVGETSDPARWAEIEDGWNQIFDQVKNGTLSSDEFRNEIVGTIRRRQLAPESLLDDVMNFANNQSSWATVNFAPEFITLMNQVTAADVYRVGREVLGHPFIEVKAVKDPATAPSCDGYLTSLDYAHRKLSETAKRPNF